MHEVPRLKWIYNIICMDVKLTLRISIMVAKASYRPSSPKIPPHNVLHHK